MPDVLESVAGGKLGTGSFFKSQYNLLKVNLVVELSDSLSFNGPQLGLQFLKVNDEYFPLDLVGLDL